MCVICLVVLYVTISVVCKVSLRWHVLYALIYCMVFLYLSCSHTLWSIWHDVIIYFVHTHYEIFGLVLSFACVLVYELT